MTVSGETCFVATDGKPDLDDLFETLWKFPATSLLPLDERPSVPHRPTPYPCVHIAYPVNER